jgi:hypothetical protein
MDKHAFKSRLAGFAGFLAIIALFGACVMSLWNTLMPDIFGLPHLNYWQATGIMLLARILFGPIAFAGSRFLLGGRDFPHNTLRKRWMSMTEDERKAFAATFHDYHDRFSHFRDLWGDHEKKPNTEESPKERPNE